MIPQTPPTDRPLTAGDIPLTDQCRVVVHFANGIASVFSDYAMLAAIGVHSTLYPIWRARSADLIETLGNILNDMDAVTDEDDWTAPIVRASAQYQSRPATSAASEGEGDRIGTHGPDCWGWGRRHYECALREIDRLAALASPPVSERERELEGALAPFAAIARVMEARDRMSVGKLSDDNDVVASVSWEGGLGVLVMGHLRDALTLVPNPKGWVGLYRRALTAQPAGEGK